MVFSLKPAGTVMFLSTRGPLEPLLYCSVTKEILQQHDVSYYYITRLYLQTYIY